MLNPRVRRSVVRESAGPIPEVTAEATNSVFEAERQALAHVKRLARTALADAAQAFGAAVRDQQEVLAGSKAVPASMGLQVEHILHLAESL